MAQNTSVDTKTIQEILSRLEQLSSEVKEIKKRLPEPSYGSNEWWEKEIKEGEEDIKKGKYTTFNSVKDMQKHLDSLKRS